MTDRRGFFGRMLALPAMVAGLAAVGTARAQQPSGDDGGPLSLKDPRIGAAGDGSTDDSAAFTRWIDALQQERRPGYVPAGHYRLPGVRPFSITSPLVIRGAGRLLVTLDGEGAVPENIFHLGSALDLADVTFTGWRRLFFVTDGSDADVLADVFEGLGWLGDIAEVRVERCGFERITQPFYFWTGGTQFDPGFDAAVLPSIGRLVFRDNAVKDCWAGFFIGMQRLNDVWIEDNVITDLDGTPAGYTASGNDCIRGASRAIYLGRDRGQLEKTTGRFFIRNNVIRRIHDRRVAPNQVRYPEVQGINIVGASYFEITGNHIEDVYSDPPGPLTEQVTDCEGIYLKAVHGKICNNSLVNCGRGEASLTMKGGDYVQRGGRNPSAAGTHVLVNNNSFEWNHPDRRPEVKAIRMGGEDLIVSNNYIEGFGDDEDTAYGPIYEPDQGVQNSLIISGNLIHACAFHFGISLRASGAGRIVRDNIIDGLDASAGAPEQNVAGIYVRARSEGLDLRHVAITGNQIRHLVPGAGGRIVGIGIWADGGDIHDLAITDTMLGDGFGIGIWLSGNRIVRPRITGNHLAGAERALVMNAEIEDEIVEGNFGP